MSADSGLPTYRGVGGLYNDGPTEEGIPVEVALSGPMFRSRPEVTWKNLLTIEKACRGATFHSGHQILAEWEQRFERLWILTQNVDGFHSEAGSSNVIEIHGNLKRIQCTRCDFRETVRDYTHLASLPRCDGCDSLLRPQVVLFEEALPLPELERLDRELQRGFDMVFSIGTTSVFPYISQPLWMAKARGMPTIEINPDRTEVSEMVDYRIEAGAAETLQRLHDCLESSPGSS